MEKMPRSLLEKFLEWYADQKPKYTDTPGLMYGYGNSLEEKSVNSGLRMDRSSRRMGMQPNYYDLDDLYRRGMPPQPVMRRALEVDLDRMMNEHRRIQQSVPNYMNERDRQMFPSNQWEAPIYGRGRRM